MNALNRVPRAAWFVMLVIVLLIAFFIASVVYVSGGTTTEGVTQRGPAAAPSKSP